MKAFLILGIVLISLFTGCNDNESLQKYYVENQENNTFLAVDIPASLFTNAESLSPEQKEVLETVKKVNVLGIPMKPGKAEIIEEEKLKIAEILENDKYQLLMRVGGEGTRMEVYFTGDDEAVDEIIVYGFDKEKGMGIARVLGDDMNPSDILNLVRSMQSGEVNIDGLNNVTNMFIEKTQDVDSIPQAVPSE